LEITAQNKSFLRRYVEKIFMDTTDVSRPQFFVYPTLAYAPETSWEIGFSSLYVFYAKNDTLNRLSEVNGFTFFTLENQYGLWFDHALYSDKSQWFFLGRLRFQSFPLLYHGIGPDSPEDYLARVDASQILIKERILREVRNHFYIGLEMDFQRFASVDFNYQEEVKPFPKPRGGEGSTNLGFGLGVVYDTRHIVLNVREGFFSEVAFLHYDQALGSDFTFNSILTDNRLFRKVGKKSVLATQMIGQFTSGSVPFNQMALLGGESIMRGYYYGRFRDKNQLATQVEYRFLPLQLGFTKRLGAAIFAGAGTVFPDFQSFTTGNVLFAGGAGLRYLLFSQKDIFTRFDVAFTKEGPGFYLFIGEAF
jgi:hypothetical protein